LCSWIMQSSGLSEIEGVPSVVSFGTRALVAIALWLGLAALDLGPRASAAFLPGVSLPPSVDSAFGGSGIGAGSTAPDESQQMPSVWPPKESSTPTHWALAGHGESSSGSSGSSSGPSSSGGGATPWVAAGVELTPPVIVQRLRVALYIYVPS